ncbi:uracil-xanthine permease family protein [Aquibaculum arenosum]|uniref:Solute carrier family 23 protein n=1 Tax=Aquibaculum arenosum TaxID=3032591 RepID=A0ABT5YP22_9PROT|nr:solute carrier family 23 protein [Fodinicurvata sp. CAU 1616]MDF2095979.1 solute carrier family 23 protein [Fodinicurvata sp. CAU 1616]
MSQVDRSAKSAGLQYAADENPPLLLTGMLGFQVVTLILVGIVLTPLIVLRAVGLEGEYGSWVVFAALLISGLTTMLQARRIGPVGAGYPLFMGTSGAFIAIGIAALTAGGMPLMGTLIIAAALVQFVFASKLGQLRRILTPTVGGTVMMLIAVTVFPVIFDLLAQRPETTLGPSGAPLVATITFLITLSLLLFARGGLKLWGPLGGVLTGCLVAWSIDLLDVSAVATAPWFGLPSVAWPGLDLSFGPAFWGLLPAFIIVTLVGAVETYGDAIAIQRLSHREQRPLDFKVIQGAVYADGVGNLLSGVAGTLPNTTYSDSVAVVEMTGVAARRVAVFGGLMLVLLAFSPKLSALLQSVPSPVLGAFAFVILSLLFGNGLRMVTEGGLSYRNGFVVCLAFWLGMGFQHQWLFSDLLPPWSRVLLDNGITAGSIAAILLMLALNIGSPRRHRRSLAGSHAALGDLHDWLQEEAVAIGWDKPAVMRLQLAAEEALLFLLERRSTGGRRRELRLSAAVQRDGDLLAVEFFMGAQTQENILEQLSGLEAQPDPSDGEDAGLRILRGLVQSLDHQQYNEGEYLSFSVDSTPLA